jgi:cytochrome c553
VTHQARRRVLGLAAFFFSAACLAAPPAAVVTACESCHGKDGNSTTPLTPSIAGQPQTFVENQLIFFREGLRASPVMQPIAKDLKDAQVIELAKHFATRPVQVTSPGASDAKLQARGKTLAEGRHCGQCHLPTFRGQNQMPRLAGQREDYLAATMRAYRDGTRTGADTTMSEVLYNAKDDEIAALAHFLARTR